jgi:hypothetical protein
MFDLSNEVSALKTRIRFLEQRRERLLRAKSDEDSTSAYWTSSDLLRIEHEIREAKSELAQRES